MVRIGKKKIKHYLRLCKRCNEFFNTKYQTSRLCSNCSHIRICDYCGTKYQSKTTHKRSACDKHKRYRYIDKSINGRTICIYVI